MEILKTKNEMRVVSGKLKSEKKTVGLVPTMGYLHDGHLSLIRQSKKEFDVTVLSIFVNPTQFGPTEDFDKYPRDIDRDCKIAEREGVGYIFFPSVNEMYNKDHKTYVNVEKINRIMCGKFRKNHFRGVCTVVLKLFNIINPDGAIFGKKDYQQFVIIKKMVEDLDVPVKIIGLDTIRESDGLALSSRNKYLNKEERKSAPVLYETILFAEREFRGKNKNLLKLKKECIKRLNSNSFVKKIDYFDFRNPESLEIIAKTEDIGDSLLVASAIYIGSTRLIDSKIVKTYI
jgi:pantoate--beta-alanine ligase